MWYCNNVGVWLYLQLRNTLSVTIYFLETINTVVAAGLPESTGKEWANLSAAQL